MNENIIVITAAYGEAVPWTIPDLGCDCLLVSDRDLSVKGWVTGVDPLQHLRPRMASLIPKMRPDLYTDKETVIWIDAQFMIKNTSFIEWCISNLEDNDIAMMRHQNRESLIREAKAGQSEGRNRFKGQQSIEQAEYYIKMGHPDDWGLWSTGLSVRRMNDKVVKAGRDWAAEVSSWSTHCQLSAPYVFRNNDIQIADLPFLGWQNSLFKKKHRVNFDK